MTSLFDRAIVRDSLPILIIKGAEIVGKARWSAAGDGCTSMRITEGQALGWVEDMAAKHGDEVLKAKHFNPRYADCDGVYLPRGDEKGWNCLDEAFRDTRAVSESNLEYGMVPDSFKDVPGYGSKLSEGGSEGEGAGAAANSTGDEAA